MADAVLKINPETEECTFFGGPFLGARVAWNNFTYHLDSIFVEFLGKGKNKWYGGLRSGESIYCIPQNAGAVLKINVTTQVCECLISSPSMCLLHAPQSQKGM